MKSASNERWDFSISFSKFFRPVTCKSRQYFIATITGPQVKNALVSPGDGISKNGIFHFNVTSPEVAQDVTITVNITSYTSPQDYVKVTKQIYIQVVGPVIISAKVVNNGNMALVGVPITFYADGVQLYKTNISLEALSSKTVIYNWTQQDISNGEHLVTVELDPNNQFVRFEGGGTVFTQTVYVGGINYSNTDAILIMVFFLLLLVSYFVYKRPKKRRKK